MTPSERRERLVGGELLAEPRTVQELVNPAWLLYSDLLWHKCVVGAIRRDLRALESEGKVRRLPGRPARWEVVR